MYVRAKYFTYSKDIAIHGFHSVSGSTDHYGIFWIECLWEPLPQYSDPQIFGTFLECDMYMNIIRVLRHNFYRIFKNISWTGFLI